MLVRTAVKHIRGTGRVAQNVGLVNLEQDDVLHAIAPVIVEEEKEEREETES
jgi:hypothetical protein